MKRLFLPLDLHLSLHQRGSGSSHRALRWAILRSAPVLSVGCARFFGRINSMCRQGTIYYWLPAARSIGLSLPRWNEDSSPPAAKSSRLFPSNVRLLAQTDRLPAWPARQGIARVGVGVSAHALAGDPSRVGAFVRVPVSPDVFSLRRRSGAYAWRGAWSLARGSSAAALHAPAPGRH